MNTAAKLQDWIRSQENQEEAFAKLLTAYDQKEPSLVQWASAAIIADERSYTFSDRFLSIAWDIHNEDKIEICRDFLRNEVRQCFFDYTGLGVLQDGERLALGSEEIFFGLNPRGFVSEVQDYWILASNYTYWNVSFSCENEDKIEYITFEYVDGSYEENNFDESYENSDAESGEKIDFKNKTTFIESEGDFVDEISNEVQNTLLSLNTVEKMESYIQELPSREAALNSLKLKYDRQDPSIHRWVVAAILGDIFRNHLSLDEVFIAEISEYKAGKRPVLRHELIDAISPKIAYCFEDHTGLQAASIIAVSELSVELKKFYADQPLSTTSTTDLIFSILASNQTKWLARLVLGNSEIEVGFRYVAKILSDSERDVLSRLKPKDDEHQSGSAAGCLETDSAILIRLNKSYYDGINDKDLYEASRGNWAINLSRAKKAKYAYILFRGKVVMIYSIKRWSKTKEVAGNGLSRIRFTGDPAMDRSFMLGFDLSNLFKPGESSPVKYLNC